MHPSNDARDVRATKRGGHTPGQVSGLLFPVLLQHQSRSLTFIVPSIDRLCKELSLQTAYWTDQQSRSQAFTSARRLPRLSLSPPSRLGAAEDKSIRDGGSQHSECPPIYMCIHIYRFIYIYIYV